MDFKETEARNDCADEAQQQFDRPTERASEFVSFEIGYSQRGREALEHES
jgi:hypothetical protein